MPIEGLSDRRWLPRLGIIRLGRRRQGQGDTEYPEASEFFVCPPEVQAVFGEEPQTLRIMFTSDDIEQIAPQWLKCYSHSQGVICKGDGRTCVRKVSINPKTGEIGSWANRETQKWKWMDYPCDPAHCEKWGSEQCKKVMSLVFILPDVPGLGVYQINTSSFYSIMNINGAIGEGKEATEEGGEPVAPGFIRQVVFTICGKPRVSWLPLVLSLVEQTVNPEGKGRKTVHVLNLSGQVKIADLVASARKTLTQILLPELDESAPDDLFPPGMLKAANGEVRQIEAVSETKNTEPVTEPPVSVTPEVVSTTGKTTPVTETPDPVTRKAVAVSCECAKPVPAAEVVTRDHSCYHTKCAGYLCTPPIDCFPGCPHTPQKPSAAGKVPPGWEKITKEQVPDYLDLEKVWCQLNPGKSTRDMYRRLGIGGRNEATIKAWDAFLTLKETTKEPPTN